MFELKGKNGEKLWSYGRLSVGKFGMQASFKKTPELAKLIEETADGEWINLSAWEPYDKSKAKSEPKTDPVSDEIPW